MGGWEKISDWYDKKIGDEGDLWHRALIDPVLIKAVGEVKGKTILDLGCGNGYLSRRFARAGGIVTAIDASPTMIERAKSHDPNNSLKIEYLCSDAGQLGSIKDGIFDIIFSNMALMDMEDADRAISEASRGLKTLGKFVASISHPCFDNGKNSGWIVEKTLFHSTNYRRIRAYREPFSEEIPWRVSEGEEKWTTAYHRPLNWYVRVMRSFGLAIIGMEEPEPNKEFLETDKEAPFFREVPLHLVFEAVKIL